jgi:Ca-activated chloride channel family protein
MTRGGYFHAATGADLRKVYEELNSRFVMERRETEITALFSLGAVALAALAMLLSLRWFGRTG